MQIYVSYEKKTFRQLKMFALGTVFKISEHNTALLQHE